MATEQALAMATAAGDENVNTFQDSMKELMMNKINSAISDIEKDVTKKQNRDAE